ncbi:NAD-dependent epimerase [Flavobacteriales bacterium 34_180_T64]|nr:NAD-dependent epimerase [Flavobacteriales bacterium 34_180_T64]
MILVTGGTGLVGSHLLYKLLSSNESVTAIYRRKHKLEAVKHVFSYYSKDANVLFNKINWVEADITNITDLEVAFKNITHVYHCAAFVSFEPDKYHQLRQINIQGTANIVNLCISNAIEKLCYVSSVAAIGHNENSNKLINESTSWNPEDDNSVYAITKYGAEMEVWRGTQEGVNAVIINPGIILGPGFWRGAGSCSLIKKVYSGFNYYTLGVTGYVDVWDVVEIMQLLMKNPIKNQRYILVSDNLSFKTFQEKVAIALGVKPGKKEASTLHLEIGWRLDWLRHKLLGKRRLFVKQVAKTARTSNFYDSSKLINELDYNFNSIDNSIQKVCTYFKTDLE